MNPLFSNDPVERVLAMIAVRPPIPLPAWVRCPRPRDPDHLDTVRFTARQVAKLPQYHRRHLEHGLDEHDVFVVDEFRLPKIGEFRVLVRVMGRQPGSPIVYRRIVITPTLAELADDIERKRAAGLATRASS